MNIIKRNGVEVTFDVTKIINAVTKAHDGVLKKELTEDQIRGIGLEVERYAEHIDRALNVEEIQDLVELGIMRAGGYVTAQKYIRYRQKRELARRANTTDGSILSLIDSKNESIRQENSNKNAAILSTQRDYMAGEVSKDLVSRLMYPRDVIDADRKGIIHLHDQDYISMRMHNCDLVDLEEMFTNGTRISGQYIETPKSFQTACNIATQIVAQVASSQYGGQSITLSHLAPFVDVSRRKIYNRLKKDFECAGVEATPAQIKLITERRLKDEITAGVQLIQYQLITLQTTNGQTPFVTIFMYIDEVEEGQTRDDLVLIIKEMLSQRKQGIRNEQGVYITPAFPKLIYVLDEDNIREGSRYYDVTLLAAECTAKRLVPDYISAKIMREYKGAVYPAMGCRSFLTPEKHITKPDGQMKFYGRFNQGVCTINLVDVACSSEKDEERFWDILDERLELCHRALQTRHKRLLGTKSDVAPILWQDGALARLKPEETIDKLLYGGYSTISLGYAGLYECVYYMTGESHTAGGKEFALRVMQKLNDKCAQWRAEENIAYSVYGTPLESTTYKFARLLQNRFGKIPEVTDHNYITNSYHVNVREEIDAFTKLKFESEFQKLSPGGAISYVEVPNLQKNIMAVISIMQYIYENIMYAELNTKADYCSNCGFEGEITLVKDDNGKLVWECPNCGCRDEGKMTVVRRTCGYIGSQYWNQGRTAEIGDRVLHI